MMALVIALTVVFAMGITVFAADEPETEPTPTRTITNIETPQDGFTVTITPDTTDTATHTYAAYQLFAGTLASDDMATPSDTSDDQLILSDITWGSGIDTTKLADLKTALAAIDSSFESIDFANTAKSASAVAKAIGDLEAADDGTVAQKIAAAFGSVLAATPSKTGEPGAGTVTGLDPGYYLIKDNAALTDPNGAETRYILEVLQSVTVTEKASVPSGNKKTADNNDTQSVPKQLAEYTGSDWADTSDYDIGDNVPFQLNATTASTVHDYTKYHVTFEDTLDTPALKNNKDYKISIIYKNGISSVLDYTVGANVVALAVGESYINKLDGVYDSTDQKKYDVSVKFTKEAEGDDGFKLKIEFYYPDTATAAQKAADGKLPDGLDSARIDLRFTAELTSDAGFKQDNTFVLKYSNNPNSSDGNEEGTTPGDKVTVFSYTLNVDKVDKDNNPLAGAGFTLYKLKKTSSGYEWAAVGAEVMANGGTDSNTATWPGLDDGVYKLSETTTPSGYNTIDDKFFEVVAVHAENGSGVGEVTSLEIYSATVTETSGAVTGYTRGDKISNAAGDEFMTSTANGNIDTDIINNSGTVLPSTGGIGTTLFYIIGAVIVAGAVITLVARRKAKAEQ